MNPNEKPISILSQSNMSYYKAKEQGLINNLEVFKGPSPLKIKEPLEIFKEWLETQEVHFRIEKELYPNSERISSKLSFIRESLLRLNQLLIT